jgi:hypothetical protein
LAVWQGTQPRSFGGFDVWKHQVSLFLRARESFDTHVAVDEAVPRAVLGYFTLAMSSVPREAFPKKSVRRLPNYDLPLIFLARLAVDNRFAGKGVGHALISEAFRISLRVSAEVGCRCIVTDAYRGKTSWYARYRFLPIEGAAPDGPQRMFLDVRTIRSALRAR